MKIIGILMVLLLLVSCAHVPQKAPESPDKALGDLTPEERKADMEKIDKFLEDTTDVIGVIAFLTVIGILISLGCVPFMF